MLLRRETFLGDQVGSLDADDPAYFEDVDLCLTLARAGPADRVASRTCGCCMKGSASGDGSERRGLTVRTQPPAVRGRWGRSLARDHPPTLWPVHSARTLAARDAGASGRCFVAAPVMPGRRIRPDAPSWRRWRQPRGSGSRWPPAEPDSWLRLGVEVLDACDPSIVLAERAGHYDIVVADEPRTSWIAHQPQALWLGDPASRSR